MLHNSSFQLNDNYEAQNQRAFKVDQTISGTPWRILTSKTLFIGETEAMYDDSKEYSRLQNYREVLDRQKLKQLCDPYNLLYVQPGFLSLFFRYPKQKCGE